MASNDNTTSQKQDADFAQAFQDIAKGEQQASAIENNLTSLERKLDELLAEFEDQPNVESLANHAEAGSQESGANTKTTISKNASEK